MLQGRLQHRQIALQLVVSHLAAEAILVILRSGARREAGGATKPVLSAAEGLRMTAPSTP